MVAVTGRGGREFLDNARDMSFGEADVANVAMLARLGLTDDEKVRFGEQLSAILDHVSMLQKIDTSHLSATAQVGKVVNAWREDASRPSLPAATALGQSPEHTDHHFRVGAIQE